jgi:DNA polymerase III alpha subunit
VIRTGYSFKTAIGHLGDVVSRLQAIGWQHAPICDRESTFGFNRWTKLATKAGLRPIYGVELGCIAETGEKAPVVDYWRFLAIDSLRPLHDLIYQATSAKFRIPVLTYGQAMAAPGIIRIAGNKVQLGALDPTGDVYFGLSPDAPKGLVTAARAAGFKMVAIGANFYPRLEDRELYRVALGWRAETQSYPQHILSDEEWVEATARLASPEVVQRIALHNRDVILDRCRATMKHAQLLKPAVNMSLRQMCEEGAKRTGTDLANHVYRDRLDRELSIIAEKQFEDYFFIMADLMNFARSNMVCGPGRGSSSGSLVCYLLNITTIDPIPFGTLFERFIDINRSDLPDIDVDLSDDKRHMVFDYAESKYGAEHVARLGTVLLFRPKSALNQAGITLRIPKWQIEKVVDTLIERSGGDSRALQTMEDSFKDTETGRAFINEYPEAKIITPLEGHPQTAGQHAAGVVITQEPIVEYVAVDARTQSVMCDKKDSEDLNLLKIDALGLTQLSIFERTLELIGKAGQYSFLDTLPLDDSAAFEVLNRGHFAGIFQFNGSVLQDVSGSVGRSPYPINHINDIVQITAVARPGPAASGGTLAWVRRRTRQEPISTLHPLLTELTQETYGVNLFQETTMRVVRELGSFNWADTSSIRKAMSGRLGDEYFARFREKFLEGAVKNGVKLKDAELIWSSIATMGSWQMNLAHCVSYGLVSYYCCYLKAHHPIEFAAATLDAETEPGRQIALLRELKSENIDYLPFDPEVSTDRWMPAERAGKRLLVGPLTVIKGIGPAAVREILECRASGKPLREALLKRMQSSQTAIDSLYPIADAIARLHPDLAASGIVTPPLKLNQVQTGIDDEIVVLGVAERIAPIDENEPIRVQRRKGRKFPPPTDALNIFLRDDTEQLLCRVDRFKFAQIGRPVVEHGRPGKALYALKGTVPKGFRMLMVSRVKHLGDMDESFISGEVRPGHNKLTPGEQG